MPSADFCCEIKASGPAFSHDFATRSRSPEVSSTAFRTQLRDLQAVPLMEMGSLSWVSSPGTVCLTSGSCTSAHRFAPRFLRIPPRDGALALRLHQDVEGTLTRAVVTNMLGTANAGAADCASRPLVSVHVERECARPTSIWVFYHEMPRTRCVEGDVKIDLGRRDELYLAASREYCLTAVRKRDKYLQVGLECPAVGVDHLVSSLVAREGRPN